LRVSVFPNPCTKQLNVALDKPNALDYSVEIVSMLGQIQQPIVSYSSINQISISTESMQKGMYLLQLKSSKNITTTHFMVE